MKGLFFIIALLFVAVCYADPPEEIKVFQPDATYVAIADNCVCSQAQTAIVEKQAFDAALATEETIETKCDTHNKQFIPVREVATIRKYSLPKAESGTATKNADIAINSPYTNNELNKSLFDTSMKELLSDKNQEFKRNLQHTNYGYPLSAD